MIASIQGLVSHKEEKALIIQVGQLGIRVFVPQGVAQNALLNETIFLHTYFLVREQELALYGFPNIRTRHLFEILLGVSGVGPRLALATLSSLSEEALRQAVFHERPDILAQVPGIGKKMAQKIIFHLKDRLQAPDQLENIAALAQSDEEVLNALTALGYSLVEAQTALQSLPPDAPDNTEERLRLALRYFSNP